jgi:hypothetical protein
LKDSNQQGGLWWGFSYSALLFTDWFSVLFSVKIFQKESAIHGHANFLLTDQKYEACMNLLALNDEIK